MTTIVITGGTDGMGRALARTYLDRGDTVVIVGRDPAKAAALPQAHFIPADLSLVAENRRVTEEINDRYPAVHALVLCARYFRSTRFVTTEGLESTFALEYLSRFLLSHGLDRPRVIVNVSGPVPGVPIGRIHWDDLMLEHGYDGVAAQMQAGRANNLLDLAFANQHADGPTRYVLINPGPVSTSFAGQYDPATAAHVSALKRHGVPVEEGINPIIARIDTPLTEPLSAFLPADRISLDNPSFAPGDAARLDDLTRRLLHSQER
ncbi:SDR family NAD(P)-dependent oxidoreductase [Streptomyces sp. JV184]|uniref:SDR family NAD(P)-dependent oxidoreductase n=1 Tax=Streptomyces sp. JV184 TaxID=858637 RepID=UPI002E784153|nr:SDR family NAD(P)-dependent oxidoreductase [Streptomyces sp. JV184]MEE1743005.1 SDR family NAD(P)-dependent oxidoreductase [Streptomyces sp. JV184]